MGSLRGQAADRTPGSADSPAYKIVASFNPQSATEKYHSIIFRQLDSHILQFFVISDTSQDPRQVSSWQ